MTDLRASWCKYSEIVWLPISRIASTSTNAHRLTGLPNTYLLVKEWLWQLQRDEGLPRSIPKSTSTDVRTNLAQFRTASYVADAFPVRGI